MAENIQVEVIASSTNKYFKTLSIQHNIKWAPAGHDQLILQINDSKEGQQTKKTHKDGNRKTEKVEKL